MQDSSSATWRLRYGASVRDGNRVEFRVWAPNVRNLAVRILGDRPQTVPMSKSQGSEFVATVEQVREGTDYLYLLDGERERPDPVSRWQPRGVHGSSRIVDPDSFRWSDQDWAGRPLRDFIIYELHTGAFTAAGTFESVIPRLPYLRDLGITAIEIMPVAEFPGSRNWGYDGAHLYAPQGSYGGPHGLKKLIDACHQSGLAVVMDVVYNHLGPEGNYVPEFIPIFTDAHHTPWGKAINFDGPESDGVRRWIIDDALYWLTEYHVDALRLDAVHGIYDFSAHHILDELSEDFHRQAARLGRQAWVIAESDLEDVRLLNPRAAGGYALDAQWHDDFHHALYSLLTGEREGFLMDFGSLSDLAKSIADGFVFDRRYSRYRRRHYGSSSKGRPGEQFVGFIQNHDQIANTSRGKRLSSLVSFSQQKLAAVLTLCSPFVPLLFMGEEYGETAPFLYFTSFENADLAKAVTDGRKREMGAHYSASAFADPQDPATLERSKLDWSRPTITPHAEVLRLYHDLIALRKQHPSVGNCRKDLSEVKFDERAGWLILQRADPSAGRALTVCNLSGDAQSIPVPSAAPGWRLVLWTGDAAYGDRKGQQAAQAPAVGADSRITLAGFEAAVLLDQGDGSSH
ncbi:MAG TPA: malto-oligosyltrehalose trehalohydrolase [Terriglobales bacterium]|jgi:maltooligosyltrehalose trehalohydrolase|nr:malto-oligosyltrehalose trehalohydrolase [Terriglobales bacterium]